MGRIKSALYRRVIRPILGRSIANPTPFSPNSLGASSKQNSGDFFGFFDRRLEIFEQKIARHSPIPTIPARPYYYLGGNWALTQLSTGHLFYVNTDDRQIVPWIIAGGTWENFVDEIIWEYVQPGMTVIDVGANLGYYTIKMAIKVGPTGRVFSFEPNPQVLPFLTQNIAINGFDGRCTVFPIGVGDRLGQSELVVNPGCLGGAQMKELSGGGGDCHRIQLDTLDSRLSQVERISFLKIDAEGYEPLILKGARQILNRSPECAAVLEVATGAWKRFGSIPELLQPLGRNKVFFAITHQTKIIRMEPEQIEAYADSGNGLAYFLVLPDSQQFLERVSRFRITV
jgi:FkbM family methyltransferase